MNENYDDYDDDLLRHYYELELEVLRRGLGAFAQQNPNAAARLSINSDGRSDDPGVERLVQSTALLHGRHRAKIEDDYPEFTEALTSLSYPQYLRPFPSCAVAQFDIEGVFDSLTEAVRIERGTQLLTTAGRCRFRTAYDVVLAPLRIARAQYASTPNAPAGVKLPPDTSGMVSVTFCAAAEPGVDVDAAMPASVRVHLAGQPLLVAALMDTLLLRTTNAYVEDSTGRWTPLASIPLSAAGFAPQDWLFTDEKEPGQAFGLLAEYFAFADRFHFVDIDLGTLRTTVPREQLTLHLAVAGVTRDSRPAQQLAHFCADHLKLFCTPVVNLFEKKDLALRYEPKVGAWPIPVQGNDDSLTEVWSVDRVSDNRGKALDSSATLFGASGNGADLRWRFMQNRRPESPGVGRRAALGLVGADGADATEAGVGALRADVTCSNGDVPRSLTVGAQEGDMRLGSKGPANGKIALLQSPTAMARLPRVNGALWRFIGQQTPHPIRLNRAGLPALKQILQQFGTLSPVQARHIDGIVGLSHRSVMTMMVRPPHPAMVRGIEITLEIDEQRFAANSVAVFARVMERFFAPYAHTNSFVQLVIVSINRSRLWQGEPIRGASPLL